MIVFAAGPDHVRVHTVEVFINNWIKVGLKWFSSWRVINVRMRAALSVWADYVTWKTNVENRMCWSCCLVFRLCFSPWQLLITRFSPQCAHADCNGWLLGCKYFGTMCVSLLCVLRFLCLLCTECHINMLNIRWPHSSVITAVKQFWQRQVRLPNSLAPNVWSSNTSRILTLWVWETSDWAHPTALDPCYMLTSYTWWLRWHETIKSE